jgi:hypothetical protein
MSPLTLPHTCHIAPICAIELSLDNGTKAAIISCYLSQTVEAHSLTCAALAQLPHTLTHSLIILGGDFQRGGAVVPQDIHIALLPYQRWVGPTSPTFAPRHQSGQESCIDHLTIWDPGCISRQIEDTVTVQTAFLDHLGVMGTLHLPIMTTEELPPPPARPHRVPLFQYPIPQPSLQGWKAKVTVDSYVATSLAEAMGHSFLASLSHGPGNILASDSIDYQCVASTIVGLANDIQAILGDALTTATTTFPHKPPAKPDKGTLPRHLWPKSVKHDASHIRRRSKAIRRLVTYETKAQRCTPPETLTRDLSLSLWSIVIKPQSLRTVLNPPPKDANSLGVLHRLNTTPMDPTTL